MSTEYHTFHIHSQFVQLLAHIRHTAVEKVCELLLPPAGNASAMLHLRDRNGRTALHHAADTMIITANAAAASSPSKVNHAAATTQSKSSRLLEIAQLLIKLKPNLVEAADNEGNTPLQLAVINGNLSLTKLLLRSMTPHQVNIGDFELHSAVHWATVCGELDCLAVLLDIGGATCVAPDIYGAHPLHYATQSFGTIGPVGEITLSTASDPRARPTSAFYRATNYQGSSSHKLATRRANGLRILHHLLSRPDIDTNCADNEGRTPLIWAASSGNHDALLALVKAGAEISQQDKDGLSALHCASSRGHYKCAEILIMICGADVHQTDSSGCTPLFYATALGHADCVRLLIESGADADHQDHKGRTAAHCGASKGQLEALKILAQHGANLWMKNVRGDLPFHDAIKSGRRDLIRWLLDLNPKAIDDVNLYGRSALHIAAFNNAIDITRLLVERGADLNAMMKVRSHYVTPLDAAMQNGSEEVATYLRSAGAQPIAQIDAKLAEYLKTSSPIKELNARQRRQAPTSDMDDIFGGGGSRTKDVSPSDEHRQQQQQQQQKQYTKLPNLIPNGNGHTHSNHDQRNQQSRTALSTASSCTLEHANNAASNAHNKLHNMREFETQLAIDKPTHLKQAIITNVYLTTTAPVPVTGATGGPVYYVKRVPPLKKSSYHLQKGSSATASGAGGRRGGGRSKERSSSVASKSGATTTTKIADDRDKDDEVTMMDDDNNRQQTKAETTRNNVILETHDTLESSYETRDDKVFITQELITQKVIGDSSEDSDENNYDIADKEKKRKSEDISERTAETSTAFAKAEDREDNTEEVEIEEQDLEKQKIKKQDKIKKKVRRDVSAQLSEDSTIDDQEKRHPNDICAVEDEAAAVQIEPKYEHEDSGIETEASIHATPVGGDILDREETKDKKLMRAITEEVADDGSGDFEKRRTSEVFDDENADNNVASDRRVSSESGQGIGIGRWIDSKLDKAADETKELIQESKSKIKNIFAKSEDEEMKDEEKEKIETENEGKKEEEEENNENRKDSDDQGEETNNEDEKDSTARKSERKESSESGQGIGGWIHSRLDKAADETKELVQESKLKIKKIFEKSDDEEKEEGEEAKKVENYGNEEVDDHQGEGVKKKEAEDEDDDEDSTAKKSKRKASSETGMGIGGWIHSKIDTATGETKEFVEDSKSKIKKLFEKSDDEEEKEKKEEKEEKEDEEEKNSDEIEKEQKNKEKSFQRKHSISLEKSASIGRDFGHTIECEEPINHENQADEKSLITKENSQDQSDKVEEDREKTGRESEEEQKNEKVAAEGKDSTKNEDEDEEYEEETTRTEDENASTITKESAFDRSTLSEMIEEDGDDQADEKRTVSGGIKSRENFAKKVVEAEVHQSADIVYEKNKEKLKQEKIEEETGDYIGDSRRKSSTEDETIKDHLGRIASDIGSQVKNVLSIGESDNGDAKMRRRSSVESSDKITTENPEISEKELKEKDDDKRVKEENDEYRKIRKRSVAYQRGATSLLSTDISMGILEQDSAKYESEQEKVDETQRSLIEKGSDRKQSNSGAEMDRLEIPVQHTAATGGEWTGDEDDGASVATFNVARNIDEEETGEYDEGEAERRSYKMPKYKTSKRYDHIGPKVDSYWSEGAASSRSLRKRDSRQHDTKEMLPLSTSDHEQYAKINPKIINQTVEKYLRKYYLERKLFEELYDLKRYQIRTGKSNEPQAVKRLVEKFRRDIRAPGMSDFTGPYTYRSYEMYLYDLLRKLSKSNERKIAFIDKSISYEDLNSSSFDKSDIEFERKRRQPDSSSSREAARRSRRARATEGPGTGASKEDPLFDYDDHLSYGLSVDYKYEYHSSQHLDRAGKDMIDVICENLYKRTGMHGAKMDELAISHKVVERRGNERKQTEQTTDPHKRDDKHKDDDDDNHRATGEDE